MNDHFRSIDIRHHAIRQDYVNGEMRIGGVGIQENTSDILTKNLQPPLHIKHTRELNIQHTNEQQTFTNCTTKLTLNFGLPSDDQHTPRNRRFTQHQQLPLGPLLQPDGPTISPARPHTHQHINRQFMPTQGNKLPEDRIHAFHRRTERQHQELQPGILQEIPHQGEIIS
jgi:hypothetical protein